MAEHEHEEQEIIVLQDEDGVEQEFQLIDAFEVDEKRYAILVPLEELDEDEDGALILRIDEDDNGEEILVHIDDDDEFERVADQYEQLLEEDDWEDDDETD